MTTPALTSLSPATIAQLASAIAGIMSAGGGGGGTGGGGGGGGTGGGGATPTLPSIPMSGPGAMLKGAAAVVKNTSKFMKEAYEGIQTADRFIAAASEPLRQQMEAVQDTFGGFRKAQEEMTIGVSQSMRESFDTFANIYTQTGDELLAEGRSEYVITEYGKSVNLLKQVDISRKEYQKGFTDFIDNFKSSYGPALAEAFEDRMVDVKLFTTNLGLTNDELGKFVGKGIAQTGEANATMLDDLKKYSYGLSQQTGISAKLIAKDTVSIVNNMEKFGNVTVEEAARMATALKQLGVEYSQLEGMVGQFQGFDSAAQKVGELSAVFGVHLDAVEMMNLANTDQEAMMHKLRDAFNESGQSLDDMNIAQKNLLKEQMGFTDMRQMEMFLSGQVDSMDDLKAMSEEAETEDMMAASADAFNRDLKTMELAGKSLKDKMDRNLEDIKMQFSTLAPAIFDSRLNMETQLNAFEQEVTSGAVDVVQRLETARQDIANNTTGNFAGDIGRSITGMGGALITGLTVDLAPSVITAFGGALDGAESIFYDSFFAPGSLSEAGLAILKGVTGDENATRDGTAQFKPVAMAFNATIDNITDNFAGKISSNILPLASKAISAVAGSGLADALPAIEGAAPLVTTTVSEVLKEYQGKLTEIQDLNEMPDMLQDLIAALKDIGPNIQTVIEAVNALSGTPMQISVDSGDRTALQYAIFEAMKDYIHVDRGQFNVTYVGE